MDDKKDQAMAVPEAAVMEEDKSEEDETWDDQDEEIEIQIVCLFCPQTFKTMAIALEHCKMDHDFNLMDVKAKFNMDCYSYIRMVNYIRKEGVRPDYFNDFNEAPWSNDLYLNPVLHDDPWLMFDFDGLESPTGSEFDEIRNNGYREHMLNLKKESDLVTISESSFAFMEKSLKFYTEEIKKKDALLAVASEQINEMKMIANKLFSGELTREEKDMETKLLSLKLSDDSGYFKTYNHYGIHLEMLSDEVRMMSFRDAIYKNRMLVCNKTVLDVGCGSGILSLFAAQADAAKVYGVDQSDIIYHARDIVRENSFTTRIELLHGKIEDVRLPVDKVDIIVSEWLGYFLLFEGMLDSVIYARDRYLRPDGRMFPDRCRLYLVGITDHDGYYDKMMDFWDNVYGFKMTSITKEVRQEAAVLDVSADAIATTSAMVFDLNLYVHRLENTDFESDFVLKSFANGELTALCGYFTADFNMPHEVHFSTSPECPKTHWKQTVFFLPERIDIKKGTVLKGHIQCKRKPEDVRSLIITITLEDQTNVYFLG